MQRLWRNRRQPDLRKYMICRRRQIGRRVDQRAVEGEDDRAVVEIGGHRGSCEIASAMARECRPPSRLGTPRHLRASVARADNTLASVLLSPNCRDTRAARWSAIWRPDWRRGRNLLWFHDPVTARFVHSSQIRYAWRSVPARSAANLGVGAQSPGPRAVATEQRWAINPTRHVHAALSPHFCPMLLGGVRRGVSPQKFVS